MFAGTSHGHRADAKTARDRIVAVFEVCYCLRSEVKRALDVKETARSNPAIDRAIQTAARDVEAIMLRKFYPQDDTRYVDWPNFQYAPPWKIWLKDNELAVWPPVSIKAGTQALDITQIFPGPWESDPGPPWTFFELSRASNLALGGNSQTPQRSTAIQGTFGFDYNLDAMTTLAVALSDTTGTTVQVTDSSRVGTGAMIVIGTERMLVQDDSMVSTGLSLNAGMSTANVSDNTLTTNGSGNLYVNEIIVIDAERMLVVDTLIGGGYTVKRGWDGTIPTGHTTATAIGAARQLTVQRGALGTTAATHSQNASISRIRVPSVINSVAIGLSEAQLVGESNAYAGAPPGPEGQHPSPAGQTPLHHLISKACAKYRRNARIYAI
jgi:hypothetical protein